MMAKLRESIISTCEKKFVLKSLQDHNRLDGRAFDEFRELKIDFGRDWGCCLVSLGKTRVLAQVSCEVQQPKSSRPSEGILNINVELTPMAAMHFESGRQSDLSVQLNRVLEKCIKDSKALDLESLCIKVGEKVWALRVDVNILNYEGNILDCASVAALSALAHFHRPDITCDGEETVIHSYSERDPIPTAIHHYPVCISYAIFGEGNITLADPNLLEEGIADAHLTVGLNAHKELCGLHLGGNASMTPIEILQCTSKASSRASIVIKSIKDALEKDRENRAQNKVTSFEESLQFSEELNLATQDMERYLDKWDIVEQKNRKKKPKEEPMEMDSKNDAVSSGNIESLANESVVLLPNEDQADAWIVVSESEDDEIFMVPNQNETSTKEEVIEIGDESEEEEVIVLNAKHKKLHKK